MDAAGLELYECEAGQYKKELRFTANLPWIEEKLGQSILDLDH